MGLFSSIFHFTRDAADLSPLLGRTSRVAIRSPWSNTRLQTAALADIFDTENYPVSRAEAMSIPSVAKARHLVCSPLARRPLVQYTGAEPAPTQPAWLYRTASQTHPNIRMLWTLDDLLFSGWSLWAIERDAGGAIVDAVRVPPELWSFDGTGAVEVGGANPDAAEVILFSGPFEGLLEAAGPTIRAAHALEVAWSGRVQSPIPAIELHQTTDDVLEEDEIQELVDAWATARKDPNGAIAYTPFNIQATALGSQGSDGSQLFVEGRNAIRLDIANFTGLPAALLDGSMATASLTYSTSEGKRSEFIDYSVVMWQDPIEARLSMDDACPEGDRIAFDLSDWTTTPQTGLSPARED